MLAVTYAAVFAGFIPFLFAAAFSDNCTTVYPTVTIDGDGECPPAGTADVLDEIWQNISALLGEVVNCMTTEDYCYNTSAYGDPNGDFDNIPFLEIFTCTGTHITGFTIIHETTSTVGLDVIQSVQFTYEVNGAEIIGARHGGPNGTAVTVILDPEERIIRIEGRDGDLVDQLTFHTNAGRTFGPYGGDGGDPFAIDNCEPRGVFGYSDGIDLAKIGFYCAEAM